MTPERFAALYWLAAAAALAWLLYLLDPVLTPFLAAAILAYIFHPLVLLLVKWKFPRTLATVAVLAGLTGGLALLLLILWPLLQSELNQLLIRLPGLLEALRSKLLPLLQQYVDPKLQWDTNGFASMMAERFRESGGVAARVLPWLGSGGMALFHLLMNLAIIPLALFYLLRDWPQLLAHMDAAIPRRWHVRTREVVAEVDAVLAEFLRAQVAVMSLMSVYYTLALSIGGLQFALPIGIVTGLLVFVPYFGMATGLTLATLVSITQFGEFESLLWVWFVFGVGQLLEGFLVTPRLVGERIGLHPLVVIFALMAFGQLFGFFGVLLALPLSAIMLVALRYLRRWYLETDLYKE